MQSPRRRGGRIFERFAQEVREAIDKNKPESGLDRLHTYMVKLVRSLCEKHGIAVDREKPLHGLFGEYVKKLRAEGHLESEMTDRILKSSISVLQAFNDVRNDRSLAHDNPVLNYEESILIFNNVTSCVRFLRALEVKSRVATASGSTSMRTSRGITAVGPSKKSSRMFTRS